MGNHDAEESWVHPLPTGPILKSKLRFDLGGFHFRQSSFLNWTIAGPIRFAAVFSVVSFRNEDPRREEFPSFDLFALLSVGL